MFAKNVIAVASKLTTPPFAGRVAIAQVYDEYSKHHPHAGSLADFKCRLVDEARRHKLSLQRADKPELLETELRQRSETQWDGNIVHLVVVA